MSFENMFEIEINNKIEKVFYNKIQNIKRTFKKENKYFKLLRRNIKKQNIITYYNDEYNLIFYRYNKILKYILFDNNNNKIEEKYYKYFDILETFKEISSEMYEKYFF